MITLSEELSKTTWAYIGLINGVTIILLGLFTAFGKRNNHLALINKLLGLLIFIFLGLVSLSMSFFFFYWENGNNQMVIVFEKSAITFGICLVLYIPLMLALKKMQILKDAKK